MMVAAVAVMTGALVLGGCGSTVKPSDALTAPTQQEKPPLVVPVSFESEQSKQNFMAIAVHDGYYAEAKPLLQQQAEAKPDGNTFGLLGTTLYNLKDYEGAVAAWAKAAELNPELGGLMFNNMGNALRDSDQLAEAIEAYEMAIQLEPTRWTAAINMAALLHADGKTEKAVSILESALPANKDVPSLVSLLEAYRKELM